MMNDLPPGLVDAADAHDAYNAVFYELGLRWHWDRDLYQALQHASRDPLGRICHYIENWQPHLLKAYDAQALATTIYQRVLAHKPCAHRSFDWSAAATCEVGV
ncbi:MAG: hypothetical protein HY854_18335 [Burkholderiales bacterium]|nr:hypothetical protein [Burkholderiales bacterium]